MNDLFYRAFEDKYRGSRESIKARLKVYLPFVQPLLKSFHKCKALDVGCGRGEWLELLSELGFDVMGVDLNDSMLQTCRELNLNVQSSDAIDYMQRLHQDSLCIVSGFHIAEHLSFEQLQQLVQESLRVLIPGGLLILETPNPENIAVGSNSFYLDPSHQRPLPSELLSFLPEYYGFDRVKVLRLQENPILNDNKNPELIDVLRGVSPDYAIISQKKVESYELHESMDVLFNAEFGLSLDLIAGRFQSDLKNKFDELKLIRSELSALQEIRLELSAIKSSTSWKVTSPFRWLIQKCKLFKKANFKHKYIDFIKIKLSTFRVSFFPANVLLKGAVTKSLKISKTVFVSWLFFVSMKCQLIKHFSKQMISRKLYFKLMQLRFLIFTPYLRLSESEQSIYERLKLAIKSKPFEVD